MCKDPDTLWILQRCFLFSTVVRFTPFPTHSPKLGRICLADISLHTRQDLISLQGSHPQSVRVYSSSSSSSSLALLLSLFRRKLRSFMSRRPVAVCTLKVVVWALGLDYILFLCNIGRKHMRTSKKFTCKQREEQSGARVCWWALACLNGWPVQI